MQVNSYVFKSPYPSPVQTGQIDPNSKKEESQESKADSATNIPSQTQEHATSYITEQKQTQNVANTASNNSLQSSLDTFSALNSQVKAQLAYA